jgi:DNA invertase Pin-like site-specific DNA recombinase
MKICAIYARVSTERQETEMQLTDLRKYVERMGWTATEFVEKASSVKHRPAFEQLLRQAKAGKIDVVLVWRIDRFARSMVDFVTITLQLKSWNVRLISVTENVDSGDENPFSKFMLGLLALLAELERNIIVERVKAGVAEAQRQGKHCGRPVRIWDRDQAQQLRQQGWSWRRIGEELEVPQSSIRRALKGQITLSRDVPKVSR